MIRAIPVAKIGMPSIANIERTILTSYIPTSFASTSMPVTVYSGVPLIRIATPMNDIISTWMSRFGMTVLNRKKLKSAINKGLKFELSAT